MPRFEHGPGDRMQVVGQADLRFPGTCMHCGTGSCEEGYVELDVSYDVDGNQYLCLKCCWQLVELVGSVHPDDFITIMHEKATLEVKFNTTSERLEEANERLSTYDSLFSSVASTVNDVQSHSNPPTDAREDESDSTEADEQLELGINAGESEPKESVTVGGPNDLSAVTTGNTPKRSFQL